MFAWAHYLQWTFISEKKVKHVSLLLSMAWWRLCTSALHMSTMYNHSSQATMKPTSWSPLFCTRKRWQLWKALPRHGCELKSVSMPSSSAIRNEWSRFSHGDKNPDNLTMCNKSYQRWLKYRNSHIKISCGYKVNLAQQRTHFNIQQKVALYWLQTFKLECCWFQTSK